MNKSTHSEFGKLRSIIFPIHRHEFRKFIPLATIFFFTTLMYSVVRSLKDLYMFENGVAESLYYIKTFAVVPTAIVFTILYNYSVNKYGRDKTYSWIIASFTVFFTIFLFVFVPFIDRIRPDFTMKKLAIQTPKFIGLWEALRNWPYSVFYIISEMVGTFGITVTFWTFVNEVTSLKQSSRFYSFLAIGANLGSLATGIIQKTLKNRYNSKDRYNLLVLLVIFCSSMIFIIYNWMSKDIKKNPELYQIEPKVKREKKKMGFVESFKFLVNSKALAMIAVIVLSYNMIINLLEAVWKSQIEKLVKVYKDTSIADGIYADQNIGLGIITILMVMTITSPIMKKGWRFAALVTPIVAAFMGAFFFSFLLFGDRFDLVVEYFNTTSLKMAVIFGLIQVMFIKSAKYALFDPTKESAYIPLSDEEKIKGKAAVDGVGGRLGKGAASLILTTILIPIFGNGKIDNIKGYIFILVSILLVVWILAINSLSGKLKELSDKTNS